MNRVKFSALHFALLTIVIVSFDLETSQAQGPWTFKASSVILDRGHPNGLALMQDSLAPGRNLDAANLDLGWHHGWDLGGIRSGNDYDLEFEVMNVNDWDGGTTAITGPATLVQINNVQPFFVAGVTSVNATYQSEMLSAEVNMRRQFTNDITYLIGIRYMQLDEHFHADLAVAGPDATYDTATSNDLIGGQIGIDTVVTRRGPFSIDLVSKVGMYYNTALQNTSLNTGGGVFGGGATVNAADKEKGPAFIGELEIGTGLELNDNISIRFGYMLMWVEAVALAPEQVVATNFATGMGIDGSGGAFYHGALLQLIGTR